MQRALPPPSVPAVKVAAVDLGATSGRVVLADLGTSTPELAELVRFPNIPHEDSGAWFWQVDALIAEIIKGLEQAAALGAEAFAIDTWGVDFGVIANGSPLGPMRCYRDPRNNDGVDVVHRAIAWPELYAATGIQFMPINTVYQLAVEDPVRVAPGATFLPAPDYLGFLLTGHVGADVTHASTGALVDVRTRTWSQPVLNALGLPRESFPELQEPGTIRGRMQLPSGAELTHISVGGHDTASAFAAIPTADPDSSLFLSMGTWALIGLEGHGLIPTDAAREANVTHELGVDGTVRMLRNVSGMWLFEECRKWWAKEDGSAPDVPILLEAAWAAPAFAGFVDVDNPDLASPGQSPASIAKHISGDWDGTRGGLVRILFESMVITIAKRAAEIEILAGTPRNTLHVVGGPTRIAPLMQWLADATNKEVIAGPIEATALGNAAVQWKALGVVSDLAEARSRIALLPDVKRFDPSGDSANWHRA